MHPRNVGPLLKNRYFPQAFRASRPYFSKSSVAALLSSFTRGGLKVGTDALVGSIASAATASGVPSDQLLRLNFLPNETAIAQTMLQLELDGTPLYDLAPALVEALSHSDPGDMCLSDLRAPNRAYYMHWGPQPDMLLHGQHPVEGAVVLSSDTDWRIVLTARTSNSWLMALQRDSFVLRFPAVTLDLPFDQAVDLAIEEDRADYLRAFHASRQEFAATVTELDQFEQDLAVNTPVLKRALQLAANSMAYLVAYPEDARYDWQPDAPSSMLTKLARGEKEAKRTVSKLSNLGFLQVHRVGLDFQLASDASSAAGAGAGGAMEPHWRRGHWRHQAHGPEMKLRKLLWMRPTRVLGGPNRGTK